MGNEILSHLYSATIQGSILFCLVWITCRAFARLPAVWKCWLWRLVSVKFLLALGVLLSIPIVVSTPQALRQTFRQGVSHEAAPAVRADGPAFSIRAAEENLSKAVESKRFDPLLLLESVWFAGVVFMLAKDAFALRKVKRVLRHSEGWALFESTSGAQETLIRCGQGAPLRVRSFEELAAPALIGLLKPTILLPADLKGTSSGALCSALAHELAHLRRRDVAWIMFAEVVKAVFWFHPFAWLACHEQRVEAEIAADQLARNWTGTSPKLYAQHLLEWIDPIRDSRIAVRSVSGLLLSTHELVRRMRAMSLDRYNSRVATAFGAILAIPLVLGLTPCRIVAVGKPGLADSPWPRFHGDASSSGISIGSGAKGKRIWAIQAGEIQESSPVIGPDGTLYIGSLDNCVYAIDGATGAKKWTYRADQSVKSTPAVSSNGLLYFATENGTLYALDCDSGKVKWTFDAGGAIYSSPTVCQDGAVCFGTWEGMVYSVDGTSGNENWEFKADGSISADAALGSDGTLYVGTNGNSLIALNSLTGRQKWRFMASDSVESPSVSLDGIVYVGSADGVVHAVSAATGTKLWETQTGGTVIACPAIGNGGAVYVGSYDQRIYAFSQRSGERIWWVQTGAPVFSSPAIGRDGTVYAASADGKLYALDGSSGAKRWTYNAGNNIDTSPAIDSDGTVYCASTDGSIFALR